jgi:hypothetical protein
LVRRDPIGYIKGTEDRIEKDPDARIRAAIDLIFSKFAELGSVRQVFFWLDRQKIQLPIAMRPEETHEIVWRPTRYHAVLSVLKNPAYAGAYAYGRSKTVIGLDGGQKRVRRQVQRGARTREDWKMLIRDHHEGYIDWEVYQSNQAMIAHNAKGSAVRGAIKQGEALLAGLLRCGQRATVCRPMSSSFAIPSFCLPSAANTTIRARSTSRRAYTSSLERCSGINVTEVAIRTCLSPQYDKHGVQQYVALFTTHDASSRVASGLRRKAGLRPAFYLHWFASGHRNSTFARGNGPASH